MGEQSRPFHGEGHVRQSCRRSWHGGSLRGTGSGTHAGFGHGTGETRLPSLVSEDRSYKPTVKSSGGQRESERVIGPQIGARDAPGGKDPRFGRACRGGKRWGMVGNARPISPGGREPVDKVRRLQRKLWASAKRSPGRRFHALHDRIHRSDVLWAGWERVRRSRGADRLTLAAVEEHGVERMLDELSRDLRQGTCRPSPVRRVEIPKPQRGARPLGIPTVRDGVAQAAAKIVLEPVFEAHFSACSYCDDFVVLCETEAQAWEAERIAGEVLASLGLELHPDKTQVVDLREGREGFDFLGCHFRARVSGRLLERGVRRHYLHRRPSARAMKRVRQRVKDLTGKRRRGPRGAGADLGRTACGPNGVAAAAPVGCCLAQA